MVSNIGFIGLGIMGKPMAQNLLKAGYDLVVHDVVRGPVEELVAAGAAEAHSPREIAAAVDAVITMLPTDNAAVEVAVGPSGCVEGLAKGSVLVDMSTTSPLTARRIAQELTARGCHMLDAPVSGGAVGAVEGSLAIMVGGEEAVFDRLRPVLEKMGRNVSFVGDHGAGQVTKAANQIIVGLTIEAVAEALVFARKSGVDPTKVQQALMGGFAQSRVLELHGRRMLERDFYTGGSVRLHKKDTEIAISMARELGISLPGTALLSQLWNALAARGGLEWDHASMVTAIEALCGLDDGQATAEDPE